MRNERRAAAVATTVPELHKSRLRGEPQPRRLDNRGACGIGQAVRHAVQDEAGAKLVDDDANVFAVAKPVGDVID